MGGAVKRGVLRIVDIRIDRATAVEKEIVFNTMRRCAQV
jgi:hypothetical protein